MTNEIEEVNHSALIERLQKLERDNRRMKRVGAVVLVATAALIFMGQTSKNRALDGDSLTIRDASGRVRVEIGTSDDTSPTLRMYGSGDNKNASAVLTSSQNGSVLSFLGKDGSLPVTVLANNGDDGPSLLMTDFSGSTLVKPATVNTYDYDKFSGFLGRTEAVNPKTGAKTKTSAGSVTLFGKDGKVVWQVP